MQIHEQLLRRGIVPCFLATCAFFMVNNGVLGKLASPWLIVYLVKALLETVASVYALFYCFVAACYSRPSATVSASRQDGFADATAIVYLCCDDIDEEALLSVAASARAAGIQLIVHDDSTTDLNRMIVTQQIERLRSRMGLMPLLLRRKVHSGGKAAALNNVVSQLPAKIKFLMVCDSDSFVYDLGFLAKAMEYFRDPNVAIAQFRTIGHADINASRGYCMLSLSVTFYDAFVYFLDKFGWSAFLGHNAIVRVSAIRDVSGFTPGELADDIDFSVKVRLRGWKTRYAREIVCGERHPEDYGALRRRTGKWAYGCTQILRQWGWKVLSCPRLTVAERTTFLLTVSYYHFQVAMLLYLTLVCCVIPFDPSQSTEVRSQLAAALIILLITFVPSVSFFRSMQAIRQWPRAALSWGLTYGSQDLVCIRAIYRCLRSVPLRWVPTNRADSVADRSIFLPELLLGAVLLVVPAWLAPQLLLLPTTLLFSVKYLAAPLLDTYAFDRIHRTRRARV